MPNAHPDHQKMKNTVLDNSGIFGTGSISQCCSHQTTNSTDSDPL